MKRIHESIPNWAAFVTLALTTAVLGLSCGSGDSKATPATALQSVAPNAADVACASQIFNLGRPLSLSELAAAPNLKFELREVHFRDVFLKNRNEVDFAYRTEMRMELAKDRFLKPVNALACDEQGAAPPKGGRKVSRMMIPVLGDLYLPSSRITVFDQASTESDNYNLPRISEMTVSNAKYFSFNQSWMNPTSQNARRYRQIRTIGEYLQLLRSPMYFGNQKVEIREMGEGWLGVYAEKSIGRERAQLMILLAAAD
jgi:hypothetical protein